MLFNSYVFILVFLPIVLLLYYLLNKTKKYTLGKILLFVASVVFLAHAGISNVLVLIGSFLINYIDNKIIYRTKKQSVKKAALVIGIICNVICLGFFKYTNFFIDNINLASGVNISHLNIMLPIGISFYTFQQIAYLVDNFRGEAPDYGILDYSLFVTFFPKVIQGPIAYHNELIPQFNDEIRKKFNFNNFSRGLAIFSMGLSKKVLLADNFGKIVDYGFNAIPSLNSFEAILVMLSYTLQLYLDFSGYCDMAIGIASMLNIDLPWNFKSPYKAKNISEFWKCWHITLTRFLTKYIYFPLGGNRKGAVRTYINIMIVYLVSGIWHGVGYTFIVWGIMHGLATVFYRIFKKHYEKIPGFIQWILTFSFVNVAWVFFRADSISSACDLLKQIFTGGWSFSINAELTETLLQPTLISIPAQIIPLAFVILIASIVVICGCLYLKSTNQLYENFKPTVINWLCTYILLVLGILSLSGVSSFLYTNF